MHLAVHQKSESKSRNIELQRARAKLEVSNVFYAFFILKQKNVKYGVFYYFSAVSFNYALDPLALGPSGPCVNRCLKPHIIYII